MLKSPLIVLAVFASLATSAAFAGGRYVNTSEIQGFASGFQCSNPKLGWQFEKLPTLWDENARMRNAVERDARLALVTDAGAVGGASGWMYRGVTNQQFNESQILAMIFNDTTQVSESRWFSSAMLRNAGIKSGANVVAARSAFRSIPLEKRWSSFESAYASTAQRIVNLSGRRDENGDILFWPHLNIGNGELNGTPVAIQFLTPHKEYAEMYGEFVLHIREVVKRGVDLERYNYHNPNVDYKVGSIYEHDQDEYAVPSHIPAWDIQVAKVRGAKEGWHLENYGRTIYYFTKIYSERNPCDVLAIRVDRPADRGETQDNEDATRVPVGLILKCASKNPADCPSRWNHAVSNESRLMNTVAKTKVDDHPLYYIPYAKDAIPTAVASADAGAAKKTSASNDVSAAPSKTLGPWAPKPIALANSAWFLPPGSSATPTRPAPSPVARATTADVEVVSAAPVAGAPAIAHTRPNAPGPWAPKESAAADYGAWTRLPGAPPISAAPVPVANAEAAPIVAKAANPLAAIQALKDAIDSRRAEVVAHLANGISRDPRFVTQAWPLLGGTLEHKQGLLEEAIFLCSRHPDAFPLADPFALWNAIRALLAQSPHPEKVMGQCIDYAVANAPLTLAQMSEKVSACGLPKERESDTVRSIWQKSKNFSGGLNRYAFFTMTLLDEFYAKTVARHPAEKAATVVAFTNLFKENVSPPAPLLAYPALLNLRRMAGNANPIPLLATAETVSFAIPGHPVSLSRSEHDSALTQSLSLFYLNGLVEMNGDESVSAALRARAATTLKAIVRGYKGYLLNGFERELQTPFTAALVRERYTWKKNENLASLIETLEGLASTTEAEARALEGIKTRLLQRYPAMGEDARNAVPAATIDGIIE